MNAIGVVGEGLAELDPNLAAGAASIGVGGDAANICVMASRLGVSARLLGRVGDDYLGRYLMDSWSREGIDARHVRRDSEAPTGAYVNEHDGGSGRRFSYLRAGSAGSRLCHEDLKPSFFDGLRAVVVTGVTLAVSRSAGDAARRALLEAKRRAITTVCVLNYRAALGGDPGELIELAARCDIVLGSQEDLEMSGDPDRCLARLLEPGLSAREVVITDGPCPPVAYWASGCTSHPVPVMSVEDPAGAGDAFAGAYLASRLEKGSVTTAMRWGLAAASLSIRSRGCARSYPDHTATAKIVASLIDPPKESHRQVSLSGAREG